MTKTTCSMALAESRQAALARLAYAIERPGGVALLCGPGGTGKTTILGRLAEALERRSRTAEARPLVEWQASVSAGAADALPDVVLVDDAYEADAADLARIVATCLARRPAAGVVLAGEGRLLSLVAREPQIERLVRLRAVVRPFTANETRALLDATLFARGRWTAAGRDDVARTIHEIAAGIPAAAVRLADLAAVVAAGSERGLVAADIEAIHARLTLAAV